MMFILSVPCESHSHAHHMTVQATVRAPELPGEQHPPPGAGAVALASEDFDGGSSAAVETPLGAVYDVPAPLWPPIPSPTPPLPVPNLLGTLSPPPMGEGQVTAGWTDFRPPSRFHPRPPPRTVAPHSRPASMVTSPPHNPHPLIHAPLRS